LEKGKKEKKFSLLQVGETISNTTTSGKRSITGKGEERGRGNFPVDERGKEKKSLKDC